MRFNGQKIELDAIPERHDRLRGTYVGQTDDGVSFQLYVNSGHRRAGGNELMKAHISAMTRGRPMSVGDMSVAYDDIYILVGGHHRKDIRVNPNGSYSHGQLHGRTFRDMIATMLEVYAPASKPTPRSSTPKPF